MSTDKIPFTLRLPEELLDELRIIAEKEHRSVTNLIEHLLRLGVNSYNS